MPFRSSAIAVVSCALVLGGGASWLIAQSVDPTLSAKLTAGVFTVAEEGDSAFSRPAPMLSEAELKRFVEGREMMHQRWVVFPSNLGLWGRGPLSNGEVCTDCHHNNGRGAPPVSLEQPMRSMVVQLSTPGKAPNGGPLPHLIYGAQLQHQGILGVVLPEGDAHIAWQTKPVVLADGEVVELREPRVELRSLAYGAMDDTTLLSARVAPAVVGAGLIDAIPDARLQELAKSKTTMRGRVNIVWDVIKKQEAIGRFGWKANHPNLAQQIANAFLQDLGVTTNVFLEENCTPSQRKCLNQPGVQRPEISDRQFDLILFYVRALAVPARRNMDNESVVEGQALFEQLNCGACHTPEHRTQPSSAWPMLANQTIRPYTDLLLHDMGEGLADGRPDYAAGPRDWRTAPLWGIGLNSVVNGNTELLHDGRALSVEEAILWHGGEAQGVRDHYARLSRSQREALAAFVNSL